MGKAEAAFDGPVGSRNSLDKAEQVRLLTRLAADSGARRGEMAALKFSDLDGGHLGGGEVDLRTRPVRGWPLRHWSRGELLRRAGVDSPFVEDRRVENLALPEQMSVNVCQSGLVSSVTPPGLDHRDNPIDDLPGLAPFEEVEVSSIDQ